MDIDRELREVEKTGAVVLGSNETLKEIKTCRSKLVIITPNCPDSVRRNIVRNAEIKNVPLYFYGGDSEDLGLALGKPFLVSVAAVIDPGKSSILELGEKD
ncbi:hypothetical protein AKJ45_03310 [candidate division MSBL1 archaeon SCGC-AAA261F19]|uniref:Large ribosomal subunit protein eL30 n=1 Tax=candidate division MSBL1 archaeon SCGC-AAA261F19 TaxID=1698275 RepID=A0A133V8F8_9EURY|nr:hypothetical protein AKJ45_03310 [candidate division MSBL1 archaeon SCGC-AAA261F19]